MSGPRSVVPCLVHLVRAANGLEPLRAFASALRRCPPLIEYELVLAMKGFSSPEEAKPYLEVFSDMCPEPLFFADDGLDLGIYFKVASLLRRESYCFANSYAEPLVEGWLAKLTAALCEPGVGLVGATGSWASVRSWLAHSAHLPSAYRGVLPPAPVARARLLAIELERAGRDGRSTSEALKARIQTLARVPEQLLRFDAFPAYHVRTNAFVIAHVTLDRLRLRKVRDKMDAYILENGRASVTRQVHELGLRTLVVDRAGVAYDRERWHLSRTFWQGAQEGLLVADNQTRAYARGDAAQRELLSGLAWGSLAEPSAP
jgi:hypothetical protein